MRGYFIFLLKIFLKILSSVYSYGQYLFYKVYQIQKNNVPTRTSIINRTKTLSPNMNGKLHFIEENVLIEYLLNPSAKLSYKLKLR